MVLHGPLDSLKRIYTRHLVSNLIKKHSFGWTYFGLLAVDFSHKNIVVPEVSLHRYYVLFLTPVQSQRTALTFVLTTSFYAISKQTASLPKELSTSITF